MKHFEASGLWYPSDDPDNAVSGTLKFDHNGLQLVLLGSFRQGWSSETERYPIIHGVVGESPYGSFVTLIDSFRQGQKFNMIGVTSERLRSHQAAIGNFHLPNSPISLEFLELDFSYLTEWAGPGGIKVERKFVESMTYVATYQKPEDVKFSFGDKSLVFGYNFRGSESTHKTSLTEAARLLIEPVGEITPPILVHDHFRTLQNLLSFATDTPNEIEDIAYGGEKDEHGGRPKINIVFDPIFTLKERKKSLHATDMLFTYHDCQAIGINIFQKWLEFSQEHRGFCEVYFGYTYANPKYADDRLSKTLDALALLCSRLTSKSERTSAFLADVEKAVSTHFPEEVQPYFSHIIPTWYEFETPAFLLSLLQENSELMGQVIDEFPAFVHAVMGTLHSFKRRVDIGRPCLGGGDLYYAVEKIKMLIKIVILKELGFDQDSLKTVVTRNKNLDYLRMV